MAVCANVCLRPLETLISGYARKKNIWKSMFFKIKLTENVKDVKEYLSSKNPLTFTYLALRIRIQIRDSTPGTIEKLAFKQHSP